VAACTLSKKWFWKLIFAPFITSSLEFSNVWGHFLFTVLEWLPYHFKSSDVWSNFLYYENKVKIQWGNLKHIYFWLEVKLLSKMDIIRKARIKILYLVLLCLFINFVIYKEKRYTAFEEKHNSKKDCAAWSLTKSAREKKIYVKKLKIWQLKVFICISWKEKLVKSFSFV
jgi:hypothetical protein